MQIYRRGCYERATDIYCQIKLFGDADEEEAEDKEEEGELVVGDEERIIATYFQWIIKIPFHTANTPCHIHNISTRSIRHEPDVLLFEVVGNQLNRSKRDSRPT